MKTTHTLAIAATLLVLPPLPSCSSTSTPGKRVSLTTRIIADRAPHTTGRGWQVTLTEALVATGPLYYLDSAPAVRPETTQRRRARPLFGIGVAHAHPGHYLAGSALGQMLVPSSVDLLAGTSELARGEGVTGVFRSASFSFSKGADGPHSAALGGSAARVVGKATKADEAVFFMASASHDDIAEHVAEGRVDGCIFDEAAVEADGAITITVKPGLWLNLVDFSSIAPGSASAPTELPPGSTAQRAFAMGLAQIAAYRFRYSGEAAP